MPSRASIFTLLLLAVTILATPAASCKSATRLCFVPSLPELDEINPLQSNVDGPSPEDIEGDLLLR